MVRFGVLATVIATGLINMSLETKAIEPQSITLVARAREHIGALVKAHQGKYAEKPALIALRGACELFEFVELAPTAAQTEAVIQSLQQLTKMISAAQLAERQYVDIKLFDISRAANRAIKQITDVSNGAEQAALLSNKMFDKKWWINLTKRIKRLWHQYDELQY